MLSAQAAILIDADSGRVLWEHNSHQRMYPASLTKMMTGLLASESGTLDQVYRASKDAAHTGESSIALAEGEPLKLRQVLEASLIKSANDATVMLAESVGGSVPAFVQMMNNRAAAMGLIDTHFMNPHGLHDIGHYSSAADLCEIARVGMRNPVFAGIVGTRETLIPWAGKPWMRKLVNRNRLLLRWQYCDGIKTGYTRHAGRCLAASATENGWRLICVVLKCKDSWADAQTLLQWGFDTYQRQCLAQAGTQYQVRVRRGVKRLATARPERDLFLVLGAGETAPQVTSVSVRAAAPIKAGQAVGLLRVRTGREEQQVRLLATEDVPESLWARVCDTKLPHVGLAGLFCLAAGVLVHGARTKAARSRRRRLQARKREIDNRGAGDGRRQNRRAG